MTKLQIPQFWYSNDKNRSPLMSKILLPISILYQGISKLNQAITITRKSPIPVICIGNLTMGGAGKTPTARAIIEMVKDHGKYATPCFLMRGYGGKSKGPIEVNPAIHTSWNVGDEALMQAQYAPVIVSKNRHKGALLAQKLGYDLIIMDDGFQNMKLKKDISFIVIDGGFGFGNGELFPSGPLRETISSGKKRSDAAIIINKNKKTDVSQLKNIPTFNGTIKLNKNSKENNIKNIIAFAGIARPMKFFDTLEENGYKINAHYGFGDHHTYQHGELKKMMNRAKKDDAVLMTTEKDWIRLSKTWRSKISYLKISIELDSKFKKYFLNLLDELR